MTPEQKVLRDVWLAECWQPCPEWRQTRDEKADANERNDLLNRPSTDVDELSPSCADKGGQEPAKGAA